MRTFVPNPWHVDRLLSVSAALMARLILRLHRTAHSLSNGVPSIWSSNLDLRILHFPEISDCHDDHDHRRMSVTVLFDAETIPEGVV